MDPSVPSAAMDLSILVPLRDEEGNVDPLIEAIGKAIPANLRAEILAVDDGSTDATWARLQAAAAKEPRLRTIRLRRNFGQTAALAAGFDRARGEIVVTLDGDLQDPPDEIPRLLEKIREGFDLVSAWRRHRKEGWLLRRLPSAAANALLRRISGLPLHDFGTTFKAYRREVLSEVEMFGESHRFIPVLAAQAGFRVAEIPVEAQPRRFGRSKYGLGRVYAVALDVLALALFTRWLQKPLRAFGLPGVLSLAAGFLLGAALAAWDFIDGPFTIREHPGLLLLSVFLMLTGIQILAIGLVADLVARVYARTGRRPVYRVLEESGPPPPAEPPRSGLL
ncbi:MAG: glycosyltransferase family 2 protein [Planctomycetota bacterium]